MAKKALTKQPSTQQEIDKCLASAVAEGDIVNFRFLFLPFSPLRADSSEDLRTAKYQYLLPRNEDTPLFREALQLLSQVNIRSFVRAQLEKKGPPQLPSEPLVMLADNAVRLEKYTAAAQAYELLRMRRRMQEEFYRQADEALDAGDTAKGVRGYVAATGLEYDYAAFPEPMPAVPNYQSRALVLHADYPLHPEEALALQAPEQHISTALSYLLLDPEAAARLEQRPTQLKLEFLSQLVRRIDPGWQAFCQRYRAACSLVRQYGEQLQRTNGHEQPQNEFNTQQKSKDPRQISASLLGREIPDGEWWQYLKDLAYLHPAAILFVARQVVSKDVEIIMPRYRKDSPLLGVLGLEE